MPRSTAVSPGLSTAGPPNKLSGTLGVTAILFMVLAAAAPLGVVAGAVPVGALLGNGEGLPGLYVIAAVVLLLFAVGFSTMASRIPRPGAFFSFIGAGIGRPMGVGAAWMALLAYTAVQVALYAYIGASLAATVRSLGGPHMHWFAYSTAVLIVVAVLGYRHVDLSARVLTVLLVLEVLIVLVLVAAIIIQGGAEGLSATPFTPSAIVSGAPGVGLVFVVGSFLGFEATAIFRSEARDPDKTVPRATYLAVITVGCFYALASWGLIMGWGPSRLVEVITAHLDNLLVMTTGQYLGITGAVIVNVLLITSFLASILAFHNIIARYQHSMANAGLLPRPVAGVHVRHRSPHLSSAIQSGTALVLVGAFAILGLDPILQVYSWLAGVATLSVIMLMALTSVAVIVFFARAKGPRRVWSTIVAPALGGIGLSVFVVAIVAYFPVLVGDADSSGDPVFSGVSKSLLALIVIFAVVGIVQAAVLRKRDPQKYANVIEAVGDAFE